MLHSFDDIQGVFPPGRLFLPITQFIQLGDAREPVRVRVQQIVQELPKVYPYSRVFQLLLDHGLRSKVAKTRQLALDELGAVLRRSGLAACEPGRACPVIASMIADKDPNVRKAALSTLRYIGRYLHSWTLLIVLFAAARCTL